jgi:DNA polymerase V
VLVDRAIKPAHGHVVVAVVDGDFTVKRLYKRGYIKLQAAIASIRRNFSVVLEKTVRELQGTSCLELDDKPAPKQQIMCSRSFGQAVVRGVDLAAALSEFTSRAAEKLRKQRGLAGGVHVFIRTSPFRQQDEQYSNSITVPLVHPTADTATLVQSAIAGLRVIYKKGFKYAKAGVMLLDLQPESVHQGCFDFDEPVPGLPHVEARDRARLMSALDTVNAKYGRGTILLASTRPTAARPWAMRQERKSPNYTTSWEDMPIVRA